jgi:hypothetical protein
MPASPDDARFEFGPLPPGDYGLVFGSMNAELATREITLAAGERRDLGDVTLGAPARLVLASELPAGLAAEDVYVLVFAAGTRSIRGQGSLAALAGGIDLSPGSYRVELSSAVVPETHDVELRAGETTELALAPRRAVQVGVRFTLAPGVPAPESLEVTLTGASGSETRTIAPYPAGGTEAGALPPELAGKLFLQLNVAPDEPLHARFTGDGVAGQAWITLADLEAPPGAWVDVVLTR